MFSQSEEPTHKKEEKEKKDHVMIDANAMKLLPSPLPFLPRFDSSSHTTTLTLAITLHPNHNPSPFTLSLSLSLTLSLTLTLHPKHSP
jgi:hypothetical protein